MYHNVAPDPERAGDNLLTPTYAARDMTRDIPKYTFPDDEVSARTAYNLIHDELIMDGNARQNLATFVTTWMEPEAAQLMSETFDKNMIDKDEYPQTAEIEKRCISMIADLWHGDEESVGTSTIGSSEAAMLGGMGLKWRWREKRRQAGKPAERPNLVIGANAQICWHKFARYWDIELREVPCEGNRFTLDAPGALKLVDENTIGVVVIMGSTMDGSYEPVEAVCEALEAYQAETGIDIPVHVDAASGGFVAPFIQPDLVWDFRLGRVASINASGHKYGLVYPGVGWIVWQKKAYLPEELLFHVSYLGGDMVDFSINFSRPGNQVIAQYYNFLRLGRDGYRRIHEASRDVALYLSGAIAGMGPFELISDGGDIPVFCWRLRGDADVNFSLYDLAEKLRERGWLVPAYPMPKHRTDLVVQRIVVKEGLSRDMADMLLEDIRRAVAWFAAQPNFAATTHGSHFRH